MSINILQLPIHILANILRNLKLGDIRNVILTCKTFKNLIVNDNGVWRAICEDRLILHNNSERNDTSTWYNKCRISKNWWNGIYKRKVILQTSSNYMPWLKYHNSEFLIFSLGSELFCHASDQKGFPNSRANWKINVPTVKRSDVRTNDISRFVVSDNMIACGNRDGSLSIYKVKKMKKRPRLIQHIKDCHEEGQVEVSAVEIIESVDGYFIVTASGKSPSVVLWQSNERCLFQSEIDIAIPNGNAVKSLAVSNTKDMLAVGLDGNSWPILLDVNTATILMTAERTVNVRQVVRDIQWRNENTIIYVTHSGMLNQIDTRIQKIVYDAKDPFLSRLYCVKTDHNNAILVGSSEYSRCVLFDARNRSSHVQMYFTQRRPSPVYSLDFDSTKLIAAADRGLTVLNFNINGKAIRQRDYSHVFHSM
ncbi:F-box/WD repeat-containing protein 4-like [Bombyx mandarina]|uniref:F-box domain-containing protein n=2 Tax=Bombyx TaxID=7090 RepID=A0A8R2LX02_BOMMO|nr:F-box/WD repeat-containing protein 4-like [Bombyx mandarina]XP_037868099.1 F-box/WD repeat-containing protein 4 [Bombyx mori]